MSAWNLKDKSPQFIVDLDETYKRLNPLRELPPNDVWQARCWFYGRIFRYDHEPPSKVIVVQTFCWRWDPATKLYFVPVRGGNEGDVADALHRHTITKKSHDIMHTTTHVLDWNEFKQLFPQPSEAVMDLTLAMPT